MLELGSSSTIERRDLVYRYLVQKEDKLEEQDRELKLVNEEMEKIKALFSSKPTDQEKPKAKPFRKPMITNKVLSGKEEAINIITHEVRRLKDGYNKIRQNNEQLKEQVNFYYFQFRLWLINNI